MELFAWILLAAGAGVGIMLIWHTSYEPPAIITISPRQHNCCVDGHKLQHEKITNLETFTHSADHGVFWNLPCLETEGVCYKCNSVVRHNIKLTGHHDALVSRLLVEIKDLNITIRMLEAKRSKR